MQVVNFFGLGRWVKLGKIGCLLVGLSMLYGCASSARIEQMAVPLEQSTSLKFDAKLKNAIDVSDVAGGSETNPLWTSEIGNAEFSGALQESLRRVQLLGVDDKAKFELTAKLISVDQPVLGMDFKVTTKVRYSLKAKKTGKVVYEKEITADHTATMGDAFYGVERLRLANEGSAQKNIEQFLKALAKLKISKKDVSMLPSTEKRLM